ncbi:MAG: DUF3520 domain-containing protein [Planctomycetes bacterium]|nr:DUF3520 domain-containing protein [Planctomycetota bacterium]MBL7039931.1 DUF3520 domain-containing protein [Pirellulaceae bacterium]
MPERESEQKLDTRLQAVPIPGDLLRRLRGITVLTDEELDHRLRSVPTPRGLVERIRRVVADEETDRQLRDVPPRPQVVARARVIPMRRRRSAVGRLALAASMLIALGAGYFSALGGLLSIFRPTPRDPISVVFIDEGPLEIISPTDNTVTIVPTPGVDHLAVTPDGSISREPEFVLIQTIQSLDPGPAGELFQEIGTVWRPTDNWLLLRWGVLGYSYHETEVLPDLRTTTVPMARGIKAPLARGFDREFLYSRGINPPVLVASDGSSRSINAPLATDTSSLDLARRLIAEGRLPHPEQVHAEHFVAAMDYQYAPAKPGSLAIRTAAGASVFSPGAAGLVQIGVKAGVPDKRTLPATDLIVVLDTSNSMNWEGKLDAARRGLEGFVKHLGPDDRFSLIVFNDEVFHVVDEAGPDDAEEIVGLLEHLRARGGANLGSALQLALSAAFGNSSESQPARRLVLITDSVSALSRDESRAIEGMLRETALANFRFDVFDLSSEREPAGALVSLTAPSDGLVRSVRTADQVCWSLVETLTGDSSLVASEARLHVQFNPKAVAAYRLIGHEATDLGGLLPASVESDLRVGQEATALFEVWLYPNDENDVATVRLQWTEPESGQSRSAPEQRISRIQFATSFDGAPICLQAAAIAAEMGEILRQSFNFSVPSQNVYLFRPKPRSLDEVLTATRRVNRQLAERADFQRFVSLVERASRISTERRASLARAGARGIIRGRWRESRD